MPLLAIRDSSGLKFSLFLSSFVFVSPALPPVFVKDDFPSDVSLLPLFLPSLCFAVGNAFFAGGVLICNLSFSTAIWPSLFFGGGALPPPSAFRSLSIGPVCLVSQRCLFPVVLVNSSCPVAFSLLLSRFLDISMQRPRFSVSFCFFLQSERKHFVLGH